MVAKQIFAMVLSALVLPALSASGRPNAWTTERVLSISDGSDGNALNPHLGQSEAVVNLSELTMAWLVRWDVHNRPYPELTALVPTKANGGISSDGLTITYHVRHGVFTWSDGAPFDADDVVFSTAAVKNAANNEASRLDHAGDRTLMAFAGVLSSA